MAPNLGLPQEGAGPQTQLWATVIVPGVRKVWVPAVSDQDARSGSTEAWLQRQPWNSLHLL